MPINSNGSSLKVSHNFNGEIIEGDKVASQMYGDNQQREERPRVHPSQRAHPFWSGKDGRIDYENQATIKENELLQRAIDNDLSSKNIKLNPQTNDNPN